jgi:hypothetical protein
LFTVSASSSSSENLSLCHPENRYENFSSPKTKKQKGKETKKAGLVGTSLKFPVLVA